jgi:hypothetical protein
LDTTYNPVALYKLDEDLSDSSASGLSDITVGGADPHELWADVGLGLKGFYFDGTTQLQLSGSQGAIQVTGDLTIEMIINVASLNLSAGPLLIYMAATGETEDTNTLYQLAVLQTTNQLNYFAEYDAGANISYSPNAALSPGTTVLLGMVRSSSNVTFYMNGLQVGDTSTGLSSPTGGSSGTLKIGHGNIDGGVICSVKILDSALTADQMKAEFNNSLGPVLGLIP